MLLDIVIPSLNREQKLLACLNSIACSKKHYNLQVYVYFSDERELSDFTERYKNTKWLTCKFDEYKKCTVFWNNHLKQMKADAMAYLNDDVLLYEDTFDELFKTYLKHFPKYDGIMGINQSNLPKEKALESAFGVIGKNYAKQFPDMQVFCPEYYRFFGDSEILEYAKSINRFHFGENVKIEHLHPEFANNKDETHKKVRDFKLKDVDIFNRRQTKKLLWGRDLDLIGENI